MNAPQFLRNDNVELLWEVILDEEVLQPTDPAHISQVKKYFDDQIKSFYEKEKTNPNSSDLFQMNKFFISKFITSIHIQQEQQTLQKQNKPPIKKPDIKVSAPCPLICELKAESKVDMEYL